MKRVAFLELDDPAIDLLALVKPLSDHRLAMVVHSNPDSLLRKMGEISQARIGERVSDLKGEPIDVLVLASGRPELAAEARASLDRGADALVLTDEEAREYFRDPAAYLKVTPVHAAPGAAAQSVPPPPIELAYDHEGLVRWILETGTEAARGEAAVLFRRIGRHFVRHAESRKGKERPADGEIRDEGFHARAARAETFVLSKKEAEALLARGPRRAPADAVAFPIPAREGIWGVLVVERYREAGQAAESTIAEFATHVAALGRTLERAAEHARMEGELKGYALREELEEVLLGSAPLEERLGHALERFAEIMGADAGAIYLYDPAKERLQVRAMAAPFESVEGWFSYAPGRGVIGRVFRDGEATFFAPSDPEAARTEVGREGLYVVPIPGDPRPGVLVLDGCPEAAASGNRGGETASVVARAFSFALQHAGADEAQPGARERRNG
jgi:hypothetical protein